LEGPIVTIVEFLTARYDELQMLAELAQESEPWIACHGDPQGVCDDLEIGGREFGLKDVWAPSHIASWEPSFVLADIAAKRRILELHQAEEGQHPDFCGHDLRELPCPTQQLLALPFADRPGYVEGWRP
jgi:hypothetical protein